MRHLEAIIEANKNPAPTPTADESFMYDVAAMVALKGIRNHGNYNSPSTEREIDPEFAAQWAEPETGPGLEKVAA